LGEAQREPITEENVDAAMAGPEISTGEHEVVLHEEVPAVEKRVVPKERVRLEKETHTEEEEISEQVRKGGDRGRRGDRPLTIHSHRCPGPAGAGASSRSRGSGVL
jgi:Domain of unknown function (DUF2382)